VVGRASALRSVFANWAGLGVNALLSLVLTPILVHGLGSLYFGMYMLVAAVLDSCGLLDFGMRTAMFRFLAATLAAVSARTGPHLRLRIVIACCSTALILLTALAAVFLMPRLFVIARRIARSSRPCFCSPEAPSATAFLSQSFGTYLCAFRRFDFYNLNSASTGILAPVLIVVALHLHGGVIAVAAVTLGCSLLSLLSSRVSSTSLTPRYALFTARLPRPHSRVASFSGNAFLGTSATSSVSSSTPLSSVGYWASPTSPRL